MPCSAILLHKCLQSVEAFSAGAANTFTTAWTDKNLVRWKPGLNQVVSIFAGLILITLIVVSRSETKVLIKDA